jgi:hypothetical protein
VFYPRIQQSHSWVQGNAIGLSKRILKRENQPQHSLNKGNVVCVPPEIYSAVKRMVFHHLQQNGGLGPFWSESERAHCWPQFVESVFSFGHSQVCSYLMSLICTSLRTKNVDCFSVICKFALMNWPFKAAHFYLFIFNFYFTHMCIQRWVISPPCHHPFS